MNKHKRVSVIIPNWNGKDLLVECLKSLREQVYRNFEIIVVDNNSEDDSVSYLEENLSEIIILKLNRNYGFARAINEGVKLSRSKYVVFLNNDTTVDSNWLNILVQMADTHIEVASVGPKILNYYNRKLIDGVGISINEVGQAKSVGWNEKDMGQFDNEMYIFGATGGASLFRREVFIEAGMFDEKYFMYSEEVDWAFRAQFLGYKSIYTPSAVVYHKHKMSSRKKPQYLEYWQFRNMTLTIIKDMPIGLILSKWRWLKIILVHLNTIYYLLKNGFIWPAFLTDLWISVHIGYLLKKRRKIQAGRKVDDSYINSFILEKKITFFGLFK